MALLTMEIPEKLLAKLRSTGRPVQDLVIEALEQKFVDEDEENENQSASISREEVIQRMVTAGLIREPGTWDTPGAKAWRTRPEAEKQQLIEEMRSTYFADSFASNLISENRR